MLTAVFVSLAMMVGAMRFGPWLRGFDDVMACFMPWAWAVLVSAFAAVAGFVVVVVWLGASLWDGRQGAAFLSYQAVGAVLAQVTAMLCLVGPVGWEWPRAKAWVAGLGLVLLFLGLTALGQSFAGEAKPQAVLGLVLSAQGAARWALIIGIGLVAPLVEELLFRGAWFGRLQVLLGERTTLGLTSAAFGVMHLADPMAVLPLTAMGLGLGLIRQRFGSVWPCIFAHMLNNTAALGLLLFMPRG